HYYLTAKDIGDLTRIFAAAFEEQLKKKRSRFAILRRPKNIAGAAGLLLDGARVSIADEKVFEKDPVKLLRLFHLAQERELDIHPDALRQVRRDLKLVNAELRANAEANQLFLEMLTSR